MSRKQPKRRAGNMVFNTIAGLFILAIVCGVGFGVASADSSDELARAGGFGFDAATNEATVSTEEALNAAESADDSQPVYYEQSVLASTSQRSIENGLLMIDEREEAERQQAIIENAAAIERVEASKEKQGSVQALQAEALKLFEEDVYDFDLPDVDWSVGQENFVSEWTFRIDKYLNGSPLAGYGRVFAEAAWDNGVDPRWSPAISNTESSKGSVCFLPYNAWGWGDYSWDNWESAIRAHVAGLADGYGYCITREAAVKYCPPNSVNWYANTASEMATI